MNSKVNEMWMLLDAYQVQADANGHGKSWALMCELKIGIACFKASEEVENISVKVIKATEAADHVCGHSSSASDARRKALKLIGNHVDRYRDAFLAGASAIEEDQASFYAQQAIDCIEEETAEKLKGKLNEMWTALAAYQPKADADGHGESWKKMCSKKTGRTTHLADYDARFIQDANPAAADAAGYACAAGGASAANYCYVFAQQAIDFIKRTTGETK
jgi:hypothetical protein